MQDAAEAAVRDGLRRLRIKGLQVALVAIEPANGNILAMVGGSDFAVTPFNRAVNSRRQPGSAFKPFVYAAALERGLSPVTRLRGLQQVAVEASTGVWIPRDEQADGRDEMTLREALLESNNAAAVLLQQQVGTRPVLQLVRDLGVPESARRAVAGARKRAGHAARADDRIRGLPERRLPRALARNPIGRERVRARPSSTRTSSASGSCRKMSRSRW